MDQLYQKVVVFNIFIIFRYITLLTLMSEHVLLHVAKVEFLIEKLTAFCTALLGRVTDYYRSLTKDAEFGEPRADPLAWHYIVDWCSKVEEINQWLSTYLKSADKLMDDVEKKRIVSKHLFYKREMEDNQHLFKLIVEGDFYKDMRSESLGKIDNASNRVSDVRQQVDLLNAKLIAIQKERDVQIQSNTDAAQAINDLLDEIVIYKKQIEDQDLVKQKDSGEIARLNDINIAQKSEIQAHETELHRLKNAIFDLDTKEKDLNDENNELKNKLQNAISTNNKQEIINLLTDNDRLLDEISTLHAEILDYQEKQKQDADALALLQKSIGDGDVDQNVLQDSINELTTKNKNLENDIARLTTDVSRLENELQDLTSSNNKSLSQNQILSDTVADNQKFIDQTEAMLEKNLTTIERLNEQIQKFQKDNSQMHTVINNLEATISVLEESVKQMEKTVATITRNASNGHTDGLSKAKIAKYTKGILDSMAKMKNKFGDQYLSFPDQASEASNLYKELLELMEKSLDLFTNQDENYKVLSRPIDALTTSFIMYIGSRKQIMDKEAQRRLKKEVDRSNKNGTIVGADPSSAKFDDLHPGPTAASPPASSPTGKSSSKKGGKAASGK